MCWCEKICSIDLNWRFNIQRSIFSYFHWLNHFLIDLKCFIFRFHISKRFISDFTLIFVVYSIFSTSIFNMFRWSNYIIEKVTSLKKSHRWKNMICNRWKSCIVEKTMHRLKSNNLTWCSLLKFINKSLIDVNIKC